METKPIVVYVESSCHAGLSEYNCDKDALIYFLKKNLNCEVVWYEHGYYFREDIDRIKRYYIYNHLMLVIVKQEEYDSDQHEDVINLTKEFLKKTPVIVIPEIYGEERFKGDARRKLYVCHHESKELVKLVKKLRSEWKPSQNWLGAETSQDRATLYSQLEDAYTSTHSEEDGMLGTPDHNHMVVSQALRLRILPDLIKEEFDDTIKPDKNELVVINDELFWEEVERIEVMSEDEMKQFNRACVGQIDCDGVGCGSNVNGFAIDPKTLETQITNRFGQHESARLFLRKRILSIGTLLNGGSYLGEEYEYNYHIIKGFIFFGVEGFSTPILQLHEDLDKRTINFLYEQRKFIPVNIEGKLFKK